MRPDVKLGVVMSAVAVLVAGGYFIYRDKTQAPIPMATGQKASPETAAPEKLPGEPVIASKQEPAPKPRTGERAGLSRRAERPDPRRARPGGTVNRTRTSQVRRAPTPVRPSVMAEATSDEMVGPPSPPPTRTRTRTPLAGQNRSRRPVSLAAKKREAPRIASKPQSEKDKVAVDTHRVEAGDTISALAERYYGSSSFTQFLLQSNPQITDPNRLRVGAIVRIPPRSPQVGSQGGRPPIPAAAARRTYVVRPGDSFYRIARDVLGDASRWEEVFTLNRQLVHGDPKRLQVGQTLVLPNP